MKKVLLTTLMTGTVLTLSGCGSSSSAPTTGTAFYIDSAVEGVTVTCGSTVSTTDSLGRFTYVSGEVCSFKLGDILLREKGGITEGEKVFENNIQVAQFLQSLDVDNNPSNGITISAEVLEILANNGIVTLPQSDAELASIVQLLQADGVSFGGEYVTEDEARVHLDETSRELDDGSNDDGSNDDGSNDDGSNDDGGDDGIVGNDDENDVTDTDSGAS